MSLDININLIDNENVTQGSFCRAELEFCNNTTQDIFIKEIESYFEIHCSINLSNLKRFNKQGDVDIFLQKLNAKYEIINDTSKDSSHILLLQSCNKLIENGILKSGDKFKVIAKIKIPEEATVTYRSKCIQIWSLLKFRMESVNCQSNLSDFVIPVNVITPNLYSHLALENEENQDNNPFEVKEKNLKPSQSSEFSTDMVFDRNITPKYRITYQDSELCYLTLLKSQICVGDDINIILNFVPKSDIRCIEFVVTLKVKENLLIPNDYPKDSDRICLSTKEFGPYHHNTSFIEIFPLTIKVNADQYPSMESDVFELYWFLEFKFMITDSKDLSLCADQVLLGQEPISWELKHTNKVDLQRWDLPLIIYPQIKSDNF